MQYFNLGGNTGIRIATAPATVPFHPSQLAGGQLYLRKDQATVSSWVSDIGTSRNFAQGTALQQPTISANSVDFVPNQNLFINESNAFGSDTVGLIFFSIYYTLGVTQYILASADNATDDFNFRLFAQSLTDKIVLQVMQNSTTNNLITLDTTTLVNGYNYGYVGSNGSSYFGKLNGVSQTISASIADDGAWWNAVPNRDNLSLAAWFRLLVTVRALNLNKLYYNNTSLTATELSQMDLFMSNPTNY